MKKTTKLVKPTGNKKATLKGMIAHIQKTHAAASKLPHKIGAIIALLTLMPDGEAKSGRSGSVVYQRNGVRRNFVVPALVQNDFTQPVRSSFSINTSGFRDLTQGQIGAWNAAAPHFNYIDRFGRVKPFPSGIALFNSLNRNLFSAGQSPITDPPTPEGVPAIDRMSIVADESAQTLTITYTPTPTDGSVTHLVFATKGLSPGVSRARKSDFRLIDTIASGAASPFAGGADYTAKFGPIVQGQKIFVKLRPINNTTGQAGAEIVASTVAVA